MDELFSLPWLVIGRRGAALTAGPRTLVEAMDKHHDAHVEKAIDSRGSPYRESS